MPKVLMLFPHVAQALIDATLRGEEPRERLYGLVELREMGWTVDVADSRFDGLSGWLRRRFGWLMNPIDFRTAIKIARSDILLVKDDFSLMAAIVGRVLGKRVIFLDSMFEIPRRFWRRWSALLCIRLAHRVYAFSRSQVALWVRALDLDEASFRCTRFTVDVPFYRAEHRRGAASPYVFAVGRDTGRDFQSLVDAMHGLQAALKLVTLPYLSRRLDPGDVELNVVERVSYQQLFNLYAGAAAAVVPLRSGITYPSGIRAVLEAMALGTPVVATRTPVLEEFFQHEQHLLYAEAGDADSIRRQLDRIFEDREFADAMAMRARREIERNFDMPLYAAFLHAALEEETRAH